MTNGYLLTDGTTTHDSKISQKNRERHSGKMSELPRVWEEDK